MGAGSTRDQTHNLVTNVKANGGLPATKLIHPKGSEVVIYHYGATVTSFKTSSKREGGVVALTHPHDTFSHAHSCNLTFDTIVLFVSSKAKFDGSKPIRGGIPIIFPKVKVAYSFSCVSKPIHRIALVPFVQFGDGLRGDKTLFSHGFARRSQWLLVSSGQKQTSTVRIVEFPASCLCRV